MYSAVVSTPSRRVSTETPSHLVPSFDHLVTQWISVVISSEGSSLNSSHLLLLGSSTSPSTEKSHCSRGVWGVGPAERTGKPSSRYCPGGSAVSWLLRRPKKPLEKNPSTITFPPRSSIRTLALTKIQSICGVSSSPLLSPGNATLPTCNLRERHPPGSRRSDPGSPHPASRTRQPAPAAAGPTARLKRGLFPRVSGGRPHPCGGTLPGTKASPSPPRGPRSSAGSRCAPSLRLPFGDRCGNGPPVLRDRARRPRPPVNAVT